MNKQELAESKYHGAEKYNCTQAVLATFQAESGMTDEEIQSYSKTGGGRAEGGVCGALHAAKALLGDSPDLAALQGRFTQRGGSQKCREIRKNGSLPCKSCVGLAAEFIAQHLR